MATTASSIVAPSISHLAADPALIIPLVLDDALHLLGAIVIIIAGFWIAGRVDHVVIRVLRKSNHVDDMLRGFFASIARYFVLTITLLAVLSQFGIQTTSLVAVIGAASLAIGLALQGTLSNLAAGVMLLIFRPFRTGHSVTVGGNTGTVRGLALFWTEIVTDTNTQIIVPNGSVWGQPIRNMSTYPQPVPTAQLRVPLPPGWGLSDACSHIEDIVTTTQKVLATPAPTVLVDRGGTDNGIQIVITFAPEGDSAAMVKNDVLRAIDEQMETVSHGQPVA
jgi:small conductance mechanosensitive channel